MKLAYKTLQVPILIKDLNISEELLNKTINKIYQIGDEMNKETNVKAFMSAYDTHKKNPEFHPLLKKIMDEIDVNYPDDLFINHQIFDKRDYFYILDDMWCSIYKSGDHSLRHHHIPSILSFCYYLQADDLSSPLFFDDLNFEVKPKSNTLIVFPSYLNHSVEKQKELGIDRILIAGNISLEMKQNA